MYLYRSSRIQSKITPKSHLPFPKCTYKEPVLFNPKTKTNSDLPSPQCTYAEPAVFSQKTTPNSHQPIQNLPTENQQYSVQNYDEFPPALSPLNLYRTSNIQSKTYDEILPVLSQIYLYRTSSIQSKTTPHSHLHLLKCTYTEPAVFNPITTTKPNLPSPQ
jgi:hypothetical protein